MKLIHWEKARRTLVLLIVWCIAATLLPSVHITAGAATIAVEANGDLRAAVESASAGDIIQISDSAQVNVRTGIGYDEPWFINKNVTIQGGTISLRTAGIVLDADLTLKDTTLSFASSVRNAIIANGHTLILDNVQCDNYSVNLFAGSLIPADYEKNSIQVPPPGTKGVIIIRGKTSLQGRTTTAGDGNIFAGNLCMGGMSSQTSSQNGPANVFERDAEICIQDSASTVSLGTIFASGAQQKNPEGASSGKVTRPDPDNYKVSGSVTVKGCPAQVDGAGAQKTDVIYQGNDNLAERTFSNISGLSVETGNLSLNAGSNLQTGANVSISSGATLSLVNIGNAEIGNFAGGGSLALNRNQTLTISGNVTGETAVGIDGIFNNSSKGIPKGDHTYIEAAQSTESSFKLLPNSNRPDMKFAYNNGNWIVPQELLGGDIGLVKSFSFQEKSVSTNIDAEEETEIKVTADIDTSSSSYINYFPCILYVNGSATNQLPDQDFACIYQTPDDELEMYITEDSIYILQLKQEGIYTITMVIPGEYTTSGAELSDTCVLTVGEHTWDETTWETNETHHWHNCTVTDCKITLDKNKKDYAAHTFGEWIVDQEATATEEGSHHKECSVCQYTETETIPATGEPSQPTHSHRWATDWSNDAAHHWHDCQAENCDITDNSQKDGYAAHMFGEWIIDKEATATEAGSRHKECADCHYTETETIPATGEPLPPTHSHRWATDWSNDAAHHWHDCQAENCDITDNSQKDGYAAHTFGEWIVDKLSLIHI